MLGIIGGTNFLAKSPFKHAEEREIETKYGVVPVLLFKFNRKEVAFVQRHGKHQNIPPHRVNHHANIACLLYTSPSPRDRTRSRMPSSA